MRNGHRKFLFRFGGYRRDPFRPRASALFSTGQASSSGVVMAAVSGVIGLEGEISLKKRDCEFDCRVETMSMPRRLLGISNVAFRHHTSSGFVSRRSQGRAKMMAIVSGVWRKCDMMETWQSERIFLLTKKVAPISILTREKYDGEQAKHLGKSWV